MHSFILRCLFHSKAQAKSTIGAKFHTYPKMAGSMTAAAVYAATVSPASNGSSSPPHSKEKVHHAANGKGFINPWESAKGPAIVSAMLK